MVTKQDNINRQQRIRQIVEQLGQIVDQPLARSDLDRVQSDPQSDILMHQIADEFRRQRVFQIAEQRVRSRIHVHPLYPRLLDAMRMLEPTVVRYKLPVSSINQAHALLEAHDVWFIKGTATAPLYPPYVTRDQADVDVIIPDFRTLWCILNATRCQYCFERLKIHIYPHHQIAGSLDLHPTNTAARLPNIDIHVGTFHIWGGAGYNMDLTKSSNYAAGRRVVNWSDALLITVFHTAKQWFYRLRDINDLYVIISQQYHNIDWVYVKRIAQKGHLFGVLVMLLQEVQRIYEIDLPGMFTAQSTPNWLLNRFRMHNWGKLDYTTGVLVQAQFAYRRYRATSSTVGSLINVCKNSFNMIYYKNRAYATGVKRVIRPFQPNEVLVLVPLMQSNLEFFESQPSQYIDATIKVVNQGSESEYFITPDTVWVQASYGGNLDESVRARLMACI